MVTGSEPMGMETDFVHFKLNTTTWIATILYIYNI